MDEPSLGRVADITETAFRRTASPVKAALTEAIFAIAGCSGLSAPTEQSTVAVAYKI